MTVLRIFLSVFLIALIAYTSVTISNHGLGLLPIFFGDIMSMAWPGQFNFDFLGYLLMSALWVSWRHHFNKAGLLLGLFAFFGGMLFLCIYLLYQSTKVEGDIVTLMVGKKRAR